MVDCLDFICRTQNDAEALLSLVQHAEEFGLPRLLILGPIGEGGWAALVEALRLLPPLVLETVRLSEDDWMQLEQYLDNEEALNEVPEN